MCCQFQGVHRGAINGSNLQMSPVNRLDVRYIFALASISLSIYTPLPYSTPATDRTWGMLELSVNLIMFAWHMKSSLELYFNYIKRVGQRRLKFVEEAQFQIIFKTIYKHVRDLKFLYNIARYM